ncbi:uncharacterized protein [Chlorocebus sabaeus]|uniref:uncharacterized protein n=1 Tax=Chlorocebus sabaeus TaxID=60711 RepID=UPI003BF95AAD
MPDRSPSSKYRLVCRWEPPFPVCSLSLLPGPVEQDTNYLFKKESKDGPLTQLPASRRLAGPLHPPHPPRPSLPAAPAPASTQLAASCRGSGEQFGGPGRAAEAMEASAGGCSSDCRGAAPSRAGVVRAGWAAEGEWTQGLLPQQHTGFCGPSIVLVGARPGPLGVLEDGNCWRHRETGGQDWSMHRTASICLVAQRQSGKSCSYSWTLLKKQSAPRSAF